MNNNLSKTVKNRNLLAFFYFKWNETNASMIRIQFGFEFDLFFVMPFYVWTLEFNLWLNKKFEQFFFCYKTNKPQQITMSQRIYGFLFLVKSQ